MTSRKTGRPIEILLVKDNPGDARLVKEALKDGKVLNELHVAKDGVEALDFLKRKGRYADAVHPDLVLLDLNLPKTGTKSLPEELKRLEPNGDYRQVDVVRVPRSTIDLNGHVNNTEYVRWGMDALSREFMLEKSIRSVQATYLSEVFEGDELDLLVSVEDTPSTSSMQAQAEIRGRDALVTFGVLGRKSGTDTNVFLMVVNIA